MEKVLLTYPIPSLRLEALRACCELDVWSGPGLLPSAELRRRIADCAGLICLLTDRIDRTLLEAAPALRFVSSMSVGVDHIDLATASTRAVAVGHTPGVLVETTADTTFALLLAAARRVAEADRYVRDGRWGSEEAWSPDFFVGKDVAGATLGIVGLGPIGQAVARRAQGFGMRVLGWNRSARAVSGVESRTLDELLEESDFVSIHVALTADTRGLIDAGRLARMKPGAVLVNTARGGIVDEAALAEALRAGRLAAAGMDVFEREPLPADHPLTQLPNVVLTPHIGSATAQTRTRMADRAVDNALAALAGKPMPFCANPAVYERSGE